jgi:serine/threonine protein kinase
MIGRGAFGVVFAGEWRGVRVAVKQLIGYLDEEQILNVRAECALMQSCSNHPNIAKFIGLSCQGHTMCIVTQFYSNGSLHDAIIVRKMLFAPRTKLRMLREAALGVIHLHKESVIHRDIAARNVLLDEHLNVVLSDFGLARVKTDAFHHTKSSLGPVKYMAPESISKKIFSFASDCFAFGVLIWELTHVAEPYADEPGFDTFGIAMGVVNGSLRLKIDESKSIGLADLMHDCWRANGADRPTFESVLQRLTLELDKQRGDSSSSGSATRVWRHEQQRRRLRQNHCRHLGDDDCVVRYTTTIIVTLFKYNNSTDGSDSIERASCLLSDQNTNVCEVNFEFACEKKEKNQILKWMKLD